MPSMIADMAPNTSGSTAFTPNSSVARSRVDRSPAATPITTPASTTFAPCDTTCRRTIDAVAVVPGGAHPSYTHGYYARDNAAYLEWDKISADRQAFGDWMEANVLRVGPEIFAQRVEALR